MFGPSNDDIPHDEIAHAVFAKDDGYWDRFADSGSFWWTPAVKLAYQWPWNGRPTREATCVNEPVLTDAEVATIIAQSSDSYVPHLSAYLDALDDVELPRVERDILAIERRDDAFTPDDTASRDPWCADGETQSTGDAPACGGCERPFGCAPGECDQLETRFRQATCEGPNGEPARHGAGS